MKKGSFIAVLSALSLITAASIFYFAPASRKQCFKKSETCFTQANWCTDTCLKEIVNCHEISNKKLKKMATAFHKPMLPGKVITTAKLLEDLDSLDCAARIKFVDPTPNPTNDDLIYTTSKLLSVEYTIALFKGVIQYKKPTEFRFYKAKHIIGSKYHIIFEAVQSGRIVYCGNFSGVQP